MFWLVSGGALVSLGVPVGDAVTGSFRQTYPPHRLLGRATLSMQLRRRDLPATPA